MVQILDALLNQDWVYWPPSETPDKFGVYAPGTPYAVRGKADRTRRVIHTPDGHTLEISTTVFLAVQPAEHGWLMQVALNDAPAVPDDQFRIKAVSIHPDVDETETLWKAMI